ncbi:MAG: response regulator [Myxococcota bacterium]
MNKRILFVDDESAVLDGLRNLLRRQRHVWDMVFVTSGSAALTELARGPFDVIVSDLRMPQMDGSQLLQRVKDRYPAMARIVLSGHAERDTVVRALPVAHQFLSKPCDADVLRVVIERTCALQALLQDEAIRRVVGRIDKLPSVPSTYLDLTRAIGRPEVRVADLAPIVERDPAMAVKVLQLVNSEYFGLSQPIVSIRHAVVYLGVELLKGLALTASVFSTVERRAGSLPLERLQQEALLTARMVKRFLTDPTRAEEAFTAAIVRDVGKLVLALEFPEIYRATSETPPGRPRVEVEADRLGVTHAEVGAWLLGMWGVPFPIVEAVAHHHAPSRVTEGAREVLGAVHAADVWVTGDGPLDEGFLRRAGLYDRVPTWRAIADEELAGVPV